MIRSKFCSQGHDKDIVGRASNGRCIVCKRVCRNNWRNKYKESDINGWRQKCRNYFSTRRQNDPSFRLADNLRRRINKALKTNQKAGSAVKDLGCSIPEFKQYIESKFYSDMTWNNWGKVWELDHIQELHIFDLTDRDQFLKACHYTNLQPLTIEDHKKKTGKSSGLGALYHASR